MLKSCFSMFFMSEERRNDFLSKIKMFALGGLNEDGKNMYVVKVDDDIFVFDAGLKYPRDRMLGIDYIIPDFSFIKKNKDRIKGIFITHGHKKAIKCEWIILLLSGIPLLPHEVIV